MSNPHPKTGFQDYPDKINKKGRPPGKTNLTTAILKKITVEELADLLLDLVKQGDTAILRHIYDHIDGRPTQKQILSTESDEPFEIRIKEIKDK